MYSIDLSTARSANGQCFFAPLKAETNLNYICGFGSNRALNTHRLSPKTNHLTLSREIIAVCSEIHTKRITYAEFMVLSLTLHEVTFRLYRVKPKGHRINCFQAISFMPHETNYMKSVALNQFL